MKIAFTILFLVFFTITLNAQELRFETPQKLPREINTSSEESLPLLSADRSSLYFVRTLYKKNTGGGLAGQDIWIASVNTNGSYDDADNDFATLNNEGNNAVIGWSKDGNRVYLLNSYFAENSTRAGISVSQKLDGKWSLPVDLDISIDMEEDFYGAYINPAENVLIVSKNSEGSFGMEDLYVSLKSPEGQWSTFINLGSKINTEEFEMSPFIASDNKTLYFSSKGHDGIGDADIFMSTRLDGSWTKWSDPVNLGPEINSKAFDAYFTISPDSIVYFASSRNAQLADIYSSRLLPEEKKEEPLALNEKEEEALKSVIEMDRKTYEEKKKLPQILAIEQLYFDFDQSFLRELSLSILKNIAGQLKEDKDLKLELIGHTDDIGTEDYNILLSKRRALSARDYLTKLGINPDRLNTFWVGEAKPAVSNNTSNNRQKNRRVEIFFSYE